MDPIDRDARDCDGWTFPPGTPVVGADGGRIGSVTAAHAYHLAVRRDRLRRAFYVPKSAIPDFDGETITLAVAANEAGRQDCGKRPAEL